MIKLFALSSAERPCSRRQDLRRIIELLVIIPRITEWTKPRSVRAETQPPYLVLKFNERKSLW